MGATRAAHGHMRKVEIRLSERPDGFGVIYGEVRLGERSVRVNVLPPEYLWEGDIRLDGARPDPTHWQVFAEGELIARIARQEDVGAALVPLLAGR
jgi:hypothetical protein